MAIATSVTAIAAVMAIDLCDYQLDAIRKLESGSILCGGVGSGKSRTSIAYYFLRECGGKLKINGCGDFAPMQKPKDLYIITTAKKRDKLEWEGECSAFALSTKREMSVSNVQVKVDSWNNISKYVDVKNAFFILDEQRLVGSGTWVKSFLKISKSNNWILLSATPGDTWMDYLPVFLANGFYKTKSQFIARHVIYNHHVDYPKVDRYLEVGHLTRLKQKITVFMDYQRPTNIHNIDVLVAFDEDILNRTKKERWNFFEDRPIRDAADLCYTSRKVVNVHPSRCEEIEKIIQKHNKIIVFYNFNYELELLRNLKTKINIPIAEYNGHKHEDIPKSDHWIYLVQYAAGAEGWNCIETNAILFYSQNYSYKIRTQSAGRIDRMNTPFTDLYYYHLKTNSWIDLAIQKAFYEKRDFNANKDVA